MYKMHPKKQWKSRLYITVASVFFVSCIVISALIAFKDNIVFFVEPTELLNMQDKENKELRLGGLVQKDSIQNKDMFHLEFVLTDKKSDIIVVYSGRTPMLFKEGSGAIVKGMLKEGKFYAEELLAKHDENYTPK
ncbi:MAG: cytochrome c maturation protein CcmE [Proteobacteria bacterium]|nr:cytochrome c maturation protein CcmE [Pseudomonadota bacterium]